MKFGRLNADRYYSAKPELERAVDRMPSGLCERELRLKSIQVLVNDCKGLQRLERFETGQPLKAALKVAGYPILAVCGGRAACGTCHVYVGADWLTKMDPVSEAERDLLECLDAYRPHASRLSCQIKLEPGLDGLDVTLAPED